MLTPNDFQSYFRQLNGFPPFPWQQRLLNEIASGHLLDALKLPTAAGKSSLVEILIFALALKATAGERFPRRVFFTIDRRLVVDEVYEQAQRISKCLEQALEEQGGILNRVATSLLKLGGDSPLQVALMRGGMYRDDSWVESPAQPLIVVSTVDQLGSRLLFRGYGVSPGQRPIHAGLVGMDSLIVLDEAHLAAPFLQTARAVTNFAQWRTEQGLPDPVRVMEMSATPDSTAQRVFELTQEDREHPVLRKRLDARKHTELLEVKEADFTQQARKHAQQLADSPQATVIGIIVNRVADAREIFEQLHQSGQRVLLLTGRVRPPERDRLVKQFMLRIRAGRERSSSNVNTDLPLFQQVEPVEKEAPLFVVATQCVEVGVNLDLDALLTEAASLSALRQRFGRLDRLGQLNETQAVILRRKQRTVDPIYGEALEHTWQWLNEHASNRSEKKGKKTRQFKLIDMGISSLESQLASVDLGRLNGTAPLTPQLLPIHVDLFAQTSPTPQPEPPLEMFLHGVNNQDTDIQVIWRSDLSLGQESDWLELVSAMRPLTGEALTIALPTFNRWWAITSTRRLSSNSSELSQEPDTLADIAVQQTVPSTSRQARLPVLIWKGIENSMIAKRPEELHPGDTILLPAVYGGYEGLHRNGPGWNPNTAEEVPDLAEAVAYARGESEANLRKLRHTPLRVRLNQQLFRADVYENLRKNLLSYAKAYNSADSLQEDLEAFRSLILEELIELGHPNLAKGVPLANLRRGQWIDIENADQQYIGAVVSFYDQSHTGEDDTSSLSSRAVELEEHQRGVGKWAAKFAEDCQLPAELVADLETAGAAHDLGKAEERFQIQLFEGHVLQARSGPLRAKSPADPAGFRFRKQRWRSLLSAQDLLPIGWRHEFLSVRLVEQADLQAHHPALLRYLIGTHHGFGRPWVPVVEDHNPTEVSVSWREHLLQANSNHGFEQLDSGWLDLFQQMQDQYGAWGIAYLEAILRLADRRQSIQERLNLEEKP